MSRVIARFSGILATAVFASVLSMGSANAALYTSTGSCSVGDISAAADQCFGSILQTPINDSASLLNNNIFGEFSTDPTGLFGYTDWVFLAKDDKDSGVVTGSIGLSVTESSKGVGSWSVNANALDSFARVVLILKAGNTFSSYFYEPGTDTGDSGTWTTSALGDKNLSHFSIYTNEISPVPVPAAVWLFGTAMIGLFGFNKRRKTA